MRKDLQDAIKKIQNGNILPFYLIYGDDDYLINDSLQKLLEALLAHSNDDFGVAIVDSERASERDICGAVQNEPLLPVLKIVVIKNSGIFKRKGKSSVSAAKIEEYLEEDPLRAACEFCRLLDKAGLSLETIKNGEWQSLSDDEWQKITDNCFSADIKAWLPVMVEICSKSDFRPPYLSAETNSSLSQLLLASPPPQRVVILTAEGVDKNNKLFKLFSNIGSVLFFEKPQKEAQQKAALIEVANEILEKAHKHVTPSAWEAIGKKIGYDFQDALNTINKLIAYVGDKALIEDTDVDTAIGKTKEETIFELSAALTRKDVDRAISLLVELFDRGEHHQVVHAVIAREIRMLLHASIILSSGKLPTYKENASYPHFSQNIFPKLKKLAQAEGEDLLGQHPYGAFLALKNCRPFSVRQLAGYLEQLSQIDILFKSSLKEPRLLLEQFIIEVCSSAQQR